MNDYQKKRFSAHMVSAMFNTVTGKKLAVFGFAFKKDTGDTRETASVFVCRDLLQERANLYVYDPEVTREQMFVEFNYTCNVTTDTVPGLEVSWWAFLCVLGVKKYDVLIVFFLFFFCLFVCVCVYGRVW